MEKGRRCQLQRAIHPFHCSRPGVRGVPPRLRRREQACETRMIRERRAALIVLARTRQDVKYGCHVQNNGSGAA